MIDPWRLAWVLAVTGPEWLLGVAAVGSMVAAVGGQVFVGLRGLSKIRQQAGEVPIKERTVAADVAESALRVMQATINQQERDKAELRGRVEVCEQRVARCEQRWRDHARSCRGVG